MPTFIKTGYWEKIQKGYKGWLNLDDLIGSSIGTGSTGQITYWNSPTSLSGGNLYYDSVNNRLTIGAGGFSGDFEINKQSAILVSYRNNNNGVNLTNGATVYQWDMLGQRNGAAATLARMQLFYNGDGITRRGKLSFSVAETSGFGGGLLTLTQTATNYKCVNLGQNANTYLDNDTTITTTYAQHAQVVVAARNAFPMMSWDINGVVSNIMMENGNLLLNTTTDAGYKLNVNGTARFQSDVLISGSTQPLSVVGTFANKNAIRFSTENGVAGAIRLTDYYTSKVSNRPALEIYGTDNTDTLSTIPAISIISDSVTIGSTLKAGTYDWNTSSNKQFNYPTNAARYIFALSSSTGYNTHEAFLYRIGYSNVTPASRVSVAWTHSTDLSARYFYYDGLSQFGTSLASAPTANPTAYVDIVASTTTAASLRIRSGVAPTAPNDGDIWFDGTALRIRIAGVTRTINVT